MKLSDLQPRVVRLLGMDEPQTPEHYRQRNRIWYERNKESARQAARERRRAKHGKNPNHP